VRRHVVSVHLTHLPFSSGSVHVWLIDKHHASFCNGASENLTIGGDESYRVQGDTSVWSGTIEPNSVIYLHATDGHPGLLSTNRIGSYEGDHFYFSSHPSRAYADFDPRTSIARLGMANQELGTAIVSNVYELDSHTTALKAEIKKSGPFSHESVNSVFGIRVDYQNNLGDYTKSVLYTDGLYDSHRNQVFPWGTGKAIPDKVKIFAGADPKLEIASDAPSDWNGRRIILTPLLEDAGAGSTARIRFIAISR
jgi:hypothetical protein